MPKLIYKDPYIRVPQWHERIPKEVEPYRYKTPRTQRIDATFERPESPPEEVLTGYIHGEKASALEERFAQALDSYGLSYRFQYEVSGAYTLPSQEQKIDFVVYDGGVAWPVEIGSRFVHGSESDQETERQRAGLINEVLSMYGIMQLTENSYLPLDRPSSLEDAKQIVAGMFMTI